MNKEKDNQPYKKFLFNVLGIFLLLAGITLVLTWWDSVVIFFQGLIGMVIALGGLLILYIKNK